MPLLLSRQLSTASLAAIVEKCQRQPIHSPLEYDLQLRNNQLDLILLSTRPPPKPIVPPKPPVAVKPPVPPKPIRELSKSPVLSKGGSTSDEGFESDIDTISLISSENESFSVDKNKAPLAETDSANGGSGTESETETEKTNTLTQKNVNTIKESFDKQIKTQETFDLVDCVCYSDVTYPEILIFVIKNESLVFKFANLDNLQTFYTNFTTLKAVTNQRSYNNVATKYNLLQRTDQNGVTHIEIKKQNSIKHSVYSESNNKGLTNIISIDTPDKKLIDIEDTKSNNNKNKDVNLRQRAESKLINDIKLLNDIKFNTVNNKVGQKRMIVRSSSIENILSVDSKESNLVKDGEVGALRKVWNSAEDLLDSDTPRRPERRRKKKPAPPPPTQHQPSTQDKVEDVFSGQFVRVNVNINPLKDHSSDTNRLVVKSVGNEPHPKKLGQNFNIRNNFTSLLKSKEPKLVRYPQENAQTLNRPQRTPLYEKNNSWTNSVPRILKKSSRSKSETRNFQPMAYRYIDTTTDYPYNAANQNNAMFLTATGLKPKTHSLETLQRKTQNIDSIHHQPRISFAYNNGGGFNKLQENNMGNRVFGLTPKIKDFSRGEVVNRNKWGSTSDLTFLTGDKERNNLKSSIKSGEMMGKKKNEKKVTFSAYTTVQVV